jgi:pimeloyl-ACP methyl ester carboxylesterase
LNKNIYIISGLGADKRVFQLIDFQNYNPIFIDWISPLKNESIENYATRMSEQILDEKPILMGLSFGGMMIMEIAKQRETEKIILFSSAKTRNELPFYFRWIGALGLHKIVPTRLLKWPNGFSNWIFGANFPFEKGILKIILTETEVNYLSWSVNAIMRWKNTEIPNNVTHIHGTKDHILPIRFVKADIQIQDGGHFMLLNKTEEINLLLKDLL